MLLWSNLWIAHYRGLSGAIRGGNTGYICRLHCRVHIAGECQGRARKRKECRQENPLKNLKRTPEKLKRTLGLHGEVHQRAWRTLASPVTIHRHMALFIISGLNYWIIKPFPFHVLFWAHWLESFKLRFSSCGELRVRWARSVSIFWKRSTSSDRLRLQQELLRAGLYRITDREISSRNTRF